MIEFIIYDIKLYVIHYHYILKLLLVYYNYNKFIIYKI